MKGKTDKISREIENASTMKVAIPLSKQTIDVAIDYNKVNDSSYFEEVLKDNNSSIIRFILGLVSLVIDMIIAIRVIRIIMKTEAKKSYYEKKLKKILHDYDQIIVTSTQVPNLDNYNVIDGKSFEEMIDAKNNLDKSIIHSEIEPNKRSEFVIIDNNIAYVYILEDKKKVGNL